MACAPQPVFQHGVCPPVQLCHFRDLSIQVLRHEPTIPPPSFCSLPPLPAPPFLNVTIAIAAVQNHRNMSIVRNFATLRVVLGLLAISVLVAVAAVPVWDDFTMSGTLFYPSRSPSKVGGYCCTATRPSRALWLARCLELQ